MHKTDPFFLRILSPRETAQHVPPCHRCIIFEISKSNQWKRRGIASAWFIKSAISLHLRTLEIRGINSRMRLFCIRPLFM